MDTDEVDEDADGVRETADTLGCCCCTVCEGARVGAGGGTGARTVVSESESESRVKSIKTSCGLFGGGADDDDEDEAPDEEVTVLALIELCVPNIMFIY